MAVARHRYGPQVVVRVAVDSATAINAGDAVFLDVDDAKPASSEPWSMDLATTQANFVNHFLGIAQADHPANSGAVTDFPVDISPLAVYEMDCASQTHEVGDTLGMDQAAGTSCPAPWKRPWPPAAASAASAATPRPLLRSTSACSPPTGAATTPAGSRGMAQGLTRLGSKGPRRFFDGHIFPFCILS